MTAWRRAWLVARAWYELTHYDLLFKVRGFKAVTALGPMPARTVADERLIADVADALEVATCLYGKRVLCLQRSVCSARLLRAHGARAVLVIGYRPIPFVSHAWVEVDGRIIADSPAYQQRLQVLFTISGEINMLAPQVGHAPLTHADQLAKIATWDGRVDNRAELQSALGLDASSPDSMLVLAAYRRWAVDGLARVVGDWSAVITEPSDGAVVLVSDFLGVRPLYYCVQPDGVRWSRWLDVLVAERGIEELDQLYIGGFLTVGGYPNRTPYAGVGVVPGGHAVRVTTAGITVQSFWGLPTTRALRYRDERDYDQHVLHLFREGVAARLQTPAPVVAELSGGLDSSSVVAIASALIKNGSVAASKLTTVSFVHRDSLDTPYIREVEAFCSITGVHLSTHQAQLTSFDYVGESMPEGWGPLHRAVAATARQQGAEVVLTGQGGDLLMGNWFDDSLQVAAALRHGGIRAACRESLAWSRVLRMPALTILGRAIEAAVYPPLRRPALYATGGLLAPASVEHSLAPGFAKRVGVANVAPPFSTDWADAPPERRKHCQAFSLMRELGTLRQYGAAPEIKSTHPFAHRPLVEFLLSIPADVLCRAGEPRRLMRRAFAELWPERLRMRRSKSLFGGPWLEALKPLARTLLASSDWRVVERGWIERRRLTERLERLLHGLECNEPQLRQILLLEFWLRNRERAQQLGAALRLA